MELNSLTSSVMILYRNCYPCDITEGRIMKRYLSVAGLLILSSLTFGQHGIKHTRLVLRDEERGGRKIPLEIYYPEIHIKTESLENQIITDGDTTLSDQPGFYSLTDSICSVRFPVICFAHGYLLPGDQYMYLAEMLVPEGFIFIALSSGTALFPSHSKYADDLRFALGLVKRMGDEPDSPLSGLVGSRICLMGHSMGGGAMFLAASDNEEIDAAVALTPYDTRPSAIEAAAGVKVPTLIFSGTNDCITPPGKHHLPAYNRCAAKEKTFIMINGGTHCGMGVSHPKCIIGEKLAGCEPGISVEEQLSILKRYMLPWLGYYLKGEQDRGNSFNTTLESDSTVTWIRSKPLSGETD